MSLINFFIHFYKDFKMYKNHEIKEEANLSPIVLNYYNFQRIDIRTAESYIMSPDWMASKKATKNPKNEKDNECFKWSIISGLNYNKINEKCLKKYKN